MLTELVSIFASKNALIDVVFVHGLNGDVYKTWRFDETPSWHTWIANAFPEANIWSLKYRVHAMERDGGAMTLGDRADNALATLTSELKGKRKIVFVCHSYGGLLIKQLLRSAPESDVRYQQLAARIEGIVFLSTPHTGSSAANYVRALGKVLRLSEAVRELEKNELLLVDLNKWFRRHAAYSNEWKLVSFFETQKTLGIGIIVDRASSDLSFGTLLPVDADHLGMSKPPGPDLRVKETIALLETIARINAAPEKRPRAKEDYCPDFWPRLWRKVNHSTFEISWRPAAPQQMELVHRIVNAFYKSSIGEPLTVHAAEHASGTDIFRIMDDKCEYPFFLKAFRTPPTHDEISRLIEIQQLVASDGPFGEYGKYLLPLKTDHKGFYAHENERTALLSLFVPEAYSPEGPSRQLTHYSGRSPEEILSTAARLAEINLLIRKERPPASGTKSFSRSDSARLMDNFRSSTYESPIEFVARAAVDTIEKAWRDTESCLTMTTEMGVTSLIDFHPHNVFVKNGECVLILDYENASTSWPLTASVTFAMHRMVREFVRQRIASDDWSRESTEKRRIAERPYLVEGTRRFFEGYGSVDPDALEQVRTEGVRWARAINLSKLLSCVSFDSGKARDPTRRPKLQLLNEVVKFIACLRELEEIELALPSVSW